MPRILLVKTSSMGDVIHNLPIIRDIRSRYPNADIDWLVEESFADIPKLHPGVASVVPVAIRRWRKTLYRAQTWREMRTLRTRLASTAYDFILDTQGLLKSGLLARLAHGVHFGLDWRSAREPLASLCYDKTFAVDPHAHAVVRYRALATHAFDLGPDLPLDYGVQLSNTRLNWLPNGRYAVLLHATSRKEKLWPDPDWIALGTALQQQGIGAVLPWGSLAEYERARRLAEQIAKAIIAPRLSLTEAALMLKLASVVIGVDTGLVHLATAVGTPTIGIYGGSDPAKNGLYANTPICNLGDTRVIPSAHEVFVAVKEMLADA